MGKKKKKEEEEEEEEQIKKMATRTQSIRVGLPGCFGLLKSTKGLIWVRESPYKKVSSGVFHQLNDKLLAVKHIIKPGSDSTGKMKGLVAKLMSGASE